MNTANFLLEELNSDSFLKRNILVKRGYEEYTLNYDPLVKEITKIFSISPPEEEIIENYLNKIFISIKKGITFDYEVSVIALFIILHNSNMPMFFKFSSYFRKPMVAEIGNISRYICRVYGSIT